MEPNRHRRRGVGLLQAWTAHTTRNFTPFGRDLAALANQLTPLIVNTHNCGWLDGGCLIFAQGLAQWSLGALSIEAIVVHADDGDLVDHAVCCWTEPDSGGRIYLDADGLYTAEDLTSKWSQLHHRAEARIAWWPEGEHYIPQDAAVSRQLVRSLERNFGGFDPFSLLESACDILEARGASDVADPDFLAPAP
jgi:hypothetical protein